MEKLGKVSTVAVGPLGVWRGAGDESGGPLGRARPCVRVCVCVRVTAAEVNKDGRRRVALVRRGEQLRWADDAGGKERRAKEEKEGGNK